MNNETTYTLRLDEATMPTSDMQRFVDGLVRTYERRTLKAKVIQFDQGDRMYNPILNLDAVDTEPAEEDVMSARIFPAQEREQAREELMKELDRAVENYATMIATYSKTFYAFCVRVYLLVRVVTHKLFEAARVYGAVVRTGGEEHAGTVHRQNTQILDQVHIHAEVPALELHTATVMRAGEIIRSPWDTLTYSYPVAYQTVEDTTMQSAYAYRESVPAQSMETLPTELRVGIPEHESVHWTNVAQCLYLQFRYGPKQLR